MTKAAGEQILPHFASKYGLSFRIFRLSNVYGSDRDLPERVIPKLAQRALSNLPLTLNDGTQVLDFTFVDDVADLLATMPSHVDNPGVNGEVFLGDRGRYLTYYSGPSDTGDLRVILGH